MGAHKLYRVNGSPVYGRGKTLPDSHWNYAVAEVCKVFSCSRDQLLSRDRSPDRVEARVLLMLVLGAIGCSVAEIARKLGLNHSTVLYNLGSNRASARRQEQAARIAARLEPHMHDWLLSPILPEDRMQVLFYLRWLLRGEPTRLSVYKGIELLAHNPVYRLAAYNYLAAHNHAEHGWRVQKHATSLGILWVA